MTVTKKRDLKPWVLKWAPLSRVAMLALVPFVPVICAVVVAWRERKSIARETADVFKAAVGRWE